jgi:pilus assembly protein CpaB
MNVTRIAILGVAAAAAVAAALLVRGMLGGGTPASQAAAPPPAVTDEVLVASSDIAPGHALEASSVRWQAWPKDSVSPAFIAKAKQPDIAKAVSGVVVRSPLVAGQPITEASIVRAGAAGFLAATIKPGMRAIGVPVTAETGAGGFILPNDRVDVVLTRDLSGGSGQKDFKSEIIVRDVRVLAVDQTAHPAKDQESVLAKTATVELTPEQASLVAQSEQSGILSLALRALGDSEGEPVTAENPPPPRPAPIAPGAGSQAEKPEVVVFRYGVLRGAGQGPSASSAPLNAAAASSPPAEPASPPADPASVTNPITVTRAPIAMGPPQ